MKISVDNSAPLSPATLHILLALAGGNLHGYGIIQEVKRQTEGRYRLGPGTLYDNLKKLMDSGVVADAPKSASPPDDERHFYTLTSKGRDLLQAEASRLENVVTEARLRLRARRPGQV